MPTHLRRNAVVFVLTMIMVLWSLPMAQAGPSDAPPPDPILYEVAATCSGDQAQVEVTLDFPPHSGDYVDIYAQYFVDSTYETDWYFATVGAKTVTIDVVPGTHVVDVVYQYEGSVTTATLTTTLDVRECDNGYGNPKKVWICHFAGNEAGGVFYESAIGELLDGDYVLTYKGEPTPSATQAAFCEDAEHPAKLIPVEGKLILVSVNSVKNESVGHRVQNLERGISSYPSGYKG